MTEVLPTENISEGGAQRLFSPEKGRFHFVRAVDVALQIPSTPRITVGACLQATGPFVQRTHLSHFRHLNLQRNRLKQRQRRRVADLRLAHQVIDRRAQLMFISCLHMAHGEINVRNQKSWRE
ncbi:hypothetical protein LS633_27475 [Pseudomonas sp. NIBR-H-19]|uniref:hypothetical protein n=1 Tax=unclassified Pseudomonas TaxID=196821 RepID=UPI001E2C5EAE|nr:hypothetical protein [Pseudomonas sp. NIBR-H-19]UHC85098.1 hypothetical protein LS633_27475 [Pseudomonas sp. NIBR-H-19]